MPKVSQLTERTVQSQPLRMVNTSTGTDVQRAMQGLGNTISKTGQSIYNAKHQADMQEIARVNKSELQGARADIQNDVSEIVHQYKKLNGEHAVKTRESMDKSVQLAIKERMKQLNAWQKSQLQVNADAIGREGMRAIDGHFTNQTKAFRQESFERDVNAIKAQAISDPTKQNVMAQSVKLADAYVARYMEEGLGVDNANKRAVEEISGMVTDMMIQSVQESKSLTNAEDLQDQVVIVEAMMNRASELAGGEPLKIFQQEDVARWTKVKNAYKDSADASVAIDKHYSPDKSYEENLTAIKKAVANKPQKIKDEAMRRFEVRNQQQKKIEREAHEASIEDIEDRMKSNDLGEAIMYSDIEVEYPDLVLTAGEKRYFQDLEREMMTDFVPRTHEATANQIKGKMHDPVFMTKTLKDPKLLARFMSRKDYAEFEEEWNIMNGYAQPREQLVKSTDDIVKNIAGMMGFYRPLDDEGEVTTERKDTFMKKDIGGVMAVQGELNYLANQYKNRTGIEPTQEELFQEAKKSGMMERLIVGVDEGIISWTDEDVVATGLSILTGDTSVVGGDGKEADPVYEKAIKDVDAEIEKSTAIISNETRNRMILERYIDTQRKAEE